ncbi:hypothetical protein [Anaerosalibacter massiliensis]|uniref:Uncharacterized protein n=1 Tax=Anaerosalibacter massiliensis TaxID=1347392 RepID=A0A9X2MJE3_9FIRM|nr:hypothetical protein [Anaerosalibacter massiliensis]MCR2044591.1 hypothetical protein [Anaerosalibacter massiliensis]
MKIYTTPMLISNYLNDEIYTTSSIAEAVVGGVAGSIAGSIAGAIVVDMIPGPVIPG